VKEREEIGNEPDETWRIGVRTAWLATD